MSQGLLITTNFYNNMVPSKMMGEFMDAPMMFKLIETKQSGACGVTHTSKEVRSNTIIVIATLSFSHKINMPSL